MLIPPFLFEYENCGSPFVFLEMYPASLSLHSEFGIYDNVYFAGIVNS